ncbi:DUF4127 family protein [Alkalihalobacillus sp. AL-G]|uniref:DUF4127 family protein n=1 Tax=Alkalihalobacillus sp. AL-G TaxID=2926399 RepID=UPI002729CABA|nr:DUF4127 family protein [Alkalihalobacillus sp. AL-G]WLD93068.1 DUF4127 family protein [Alkalihalobacillus sp. AL-G]
MNRKLALIPVDARPVTRDLPGQIAAIAGWDVLVPDRGQLGFLKMPGDQSEFLVWLDRVASEVDGFILSLDMIGYGGLVPSRVIEDEFSTIWSRIEQVLQLKRRYPEKKLFAFSATMRISNNYVNEEEKDYWDRYGEEIWQYSYHTHCFQRTASEESKRMIDDLYGRIPSEILDDYLQTRERNFSISKKLLEKVEEKLIDILVFPQDDTSEYGLNIREQEQLSADVEKRNLFNNVFIYPGADEVATTLTARAILEAEFIKAPTFYPFYSGETGKLKPAMYEDRPIVESVKGQIHVVGGHTVETVNDADLLLGVNVPGQQQGDLALQKNLQYVNTNGRDVGEWIRRLVYYQKQGYKVAVADLAYANGADPVMMSRLLGEPDVLSHLVGFGAWNTAGNTIGTVVAQAAMHYVHHKSGFDRSDEKLKEQILLRLFDDYLYQTIVRQQVRNEMAGPESKVNDLVKVVENRFLENYDNLIQTEGVQKLLRDYEVDLGTTFLPWNRTFEIGLKVRLQRNIC